MTDNSESATLLPTNSYQRAADARTPLEVQHEGTKDKKDTKKWILPAAVGLLVCSVLLLWVGSPSPELLGSPEEGYIFESFKADFDGSMFGNFESALGVDIPGTESTVQKVDGTFWWYSNSTNDLFITSLNVGSTNIYFWENGYWQEGDLYMTEEMGAVRTTRGSSQCIMNAAMDVGPSGLKMEAGNFMSSDSSLSSMKYDRTVEIAGGPKAERWIGLIDDTPAISNWMTKVGTEALWLFIRSPTKSAQNRVLPLYHRVTPPESTTEDPMSDSYFIDLTFFNYESLSESFDTTKTASWPDQCSPPSIGRRLSSQTKTLRRKNAGVRASAGCPFKRFFKLSGKN